MKKDKAKKEQEPLLTKTLPAVRVTEATYAFVERKRREERRYKISEVVRLVLEDAASRDAA